MPKSATDVVQDAIVAAAIDAVMALKAASKGLPNTLLRDLNAIHANTTFADLPKEMQTAIVDSVRAAFTRLSREGYTVSPSQGVPSPRPPRRDPAGGQRPATGNPPGKRGPPDPRRRNTGRPNSGPKPGSKPRG